jgi:hypothetical protein
MYTKTTSLEGLFQEIIASGRDEKKLGKPEKPKDNKRRLGPEQKPLDLRGWKDWDTVEPICYKNEVLASGTMQEVLVRGIFKRMVDKERSDLGYETCPGIFITFTRKMPLETKDEEIRQESARAKTGKTPDREAPSPLVSFSDCYWEAVKILYYSSSTEKGKFGEFDPLR